MRFLDAELITVPACAPSTPRSKREIFFVQYFNQSEPGCIDRCRIAQRSLGLDCHVWVSKFSGGPVSLGAITVMATEHEVGDAIRSTTAPGRLMVEFKWFVTTAAIHALMMEFLQQIRSDFPTRQFASLVLDARYLWILHQCHIKLDLLHLDPADGNPSAIATNPGENVANA
jgi:hypothetical protein